MMVSRSHLFVVGLAALSLAALGACGSDVASSESAGGAKSGSDAPFKVTGEPVATDKVLLPKSYKYEPAVIKVKAGTAVTWQNNDDFPHNVKVFGAVDETKDLPVGATAVITFDDPGTVYYQCTLHPTQMKGKVIVEP